MPLKWERGINPYVHTYFGKLGLGPRATPPQIIQTANALKQKLQAGRPVELDGVPLDEHVISEAAMKLREKEVLAQELLLVHPQTQVENRKHQELVKRLQQAAALPEGRPAIPLRQPLAIFCFLPAPDAEAAALPEWQDFGLVGPDDEEDLRLHIVFDA